MGEITPEKMADMLDWALEFTPEEFFSAGANPNDLLEDALNSPRWRLETFCSCVERGTTAPKEILDWMAGAVRSYLAGEAELTVALELEKKRRPGRARKRTYHRAGVRAFALIVEKNYPYDSVILQVMRESGLGRRTVQRSYSEVRRYIEWCLKEE